MDEDKIELLNSILNELADGELVLDEENCGRILERLESLYSDNYRHLYSQIFAALVKIDSDCDSDKDISFIAQNIQLVYEYYLTYVNEDEDFLLKIKKLYDHVNLDCARINYIKAIQDANNESILQLSKGIEESQKQLVVLTERLEAKINETTNSFAEDLEVKINEATNSFAEDLEVKIKDSTDKFTEITNNKIDKLQKDYVAILGIFASVVITFVAGISLSNSTLAALKEAGDNFYTLVFLAILIAMFIFNSLRALFDFLLKITDRKNPFETVPLFTCDFNIIFVVMMVIDYICYICFGKK